MDPFTVKQTCIIANGRLLVHKNLINVSNPPDLYVCTGQPIPLLTLLSGSILVARPMCP